VNSGKTTFLMSFIVTLIFFGSFSDFLFWNVGGKSFSLYAISKSFPFSFQMNWS
jgi:hypothetical protein